MEFGHYALVREDDSESPDDGNDDDVDVRVDVDRDDEFPGNGDDHS